MNRIKSIFLLILLLLAGCERTGPGEYGVVFTALPRWLGGGVDARIVGPGEKEVVIPGVQKFYVIDTTLQSIGWGGVGQGDDRQKEDYVETRSLDGNEVGLAVTVQYHIDPKMVRHVVQKVSWEKDKVKKLVAAVARADIRTHMNILNTQDFFSQSERQEAVDQVKQAMNARLNREGVIVDAVIYNDHRFERALEEGSYDRSYQEKIDATQATKEETQQEKKKIKAVVEHKRKEYNEELARVNRAVQEAMGEKQQAKLYGDSYLQAKTNESQQIRIAGMSEVEGLKKRIAALSGRGGEALLRLELIEFLTKSDPQFVLLNTGESKEGGVDLTKVDANELMRQIGVFAATHEGLSGPGAGARKRMRPKKTPKEETESPKRKQPAPTRTER